MVDYGAVSSAGNGKLLVASPRREMSSIISELQREWGVISDAPWVSICFVSLIASILWAVFQFIYHNRFISKELVLSHKDAEIHLLERQLSDYREKLNGASPEEARRRVEELEARLRKISHHLVPRELSTLQKEMIKRTFEEISDSPFSIFVTHEESCIDCARYAYSLALVIQSVPGWKVETGATTFASDPSSKGMAIWTKRKSAVNVNVSAILRCFREVKIEFDVVDIRSEPELYDLTIFVCSRKYEL